jgi:hypothetical protein
MSAAIAQIPYIDNPPPNPLGFQSQLAQLITQKQQAIQAQQATQAGALNVARARYGLSMVPGFQDALAGVPGAPAPVGGASALAPAMSGGGGATPAASGTAPVSGGAAPGGASSLGPQVANTMYGVPLPPLQAMAVFSAQNPDAALKTAEEARRSRLYELANSGLPWDQAITTAHSEGYLDTPTATTLLGHEDKRAQFVQALATPDAYMSLRGAGIRAGVQPTTQGGLEVSQPILAAGAGKAYSAQAATLAAKLGLPQPGAPTPAPPASSLVDPTKPMTPQQYSDRVSDFEGTGSNQSSSATGNGQFLAGTWTPLMKKYRPDLTTGKTDAQILAMRSDDALGDQMKVAYATDNGQALAAAGVPQNATTLGIAHNLGPGDAVRVLQSSADTPLSQILSPEVIQANPGLGRQTAGQYVRKLTGAYGLQPVALPGQPAAGAPGVPAAAAPAAAPVAGQPGAAAAPALGQAGAAAAPALGQPVAGPAALPPGTVPTAALVEQQQETAKKLADVAAVAPTEAAKAPIELNMKLAASDIPLAGQAAEEAEQARDQLVNAQKIGDLASGVATGKGAEFLGSVGQWLLRAGAPASLVDNITGVDPSNAQQLSKYITRANVDIEKEATSRGGYNLMRMLNGALPSMETRPDAVQHIVNLMRVGSQVDFEVENGAVAYNATQQAAIRANPGGTYQTIPQYYAQQNQRFPSNVVVAAANLLSGDDAASVFKGMTDPKQRQEVIALAHRTNPAAVLHGFGAPPPAAAPAPAAPPVQAAQQ